MGAWERERVGVWECEKVGGEWECENVGESEWGVKERELGEHGCVGCGSVRKWERGSGSVGVVNAKRVWLMAASMSSQKNTQHTRITCASMRHRPRVAQLAAEDITHSGCQWKVVAIVDSSRQNKIEGEIADIENLFTITMWVTCCSRPRI